MKQLKKIDDDILLQKISEGIDQKDIAALFGVSPAAVCKRLKRLTPQPPSKLDSLTKREQFFCQEVARGRSQTAAALEAFDCGSRDSAKSLGSALAKAPHIQEAIQELMERVGLTREKRVRKLGEHVDSKDAGVSLKALDMSFKLADEYPAQKQVSVSVNMDWFPVDLEAYRLPDKRKPQEAIDAEAEEVAEQAPSGNEGNEEQAGE
ncbi:MAG: hypothetical protein FD174_2865 [Geobacteraceae bacterium]|nr:MAG: hypothetical protein FD174_2865 [Geobacteraceae bacterium]